jgi:hypothetical protein
MRNGGLVFSAFFSVAAALAGCGGSLTPNDDAGSGSGGAGGTTGAGGTSWGGTTGSGGSTPTGSCAALSGCECLAASDRCTPRSEACWCPTECYPDSIIDCVCGGGRFLSCGDNGTPRPCSELGACDCLAASDRCTPRAEACWCPTECNGNVCVCGGGQFLACENKAVAGSCAAELSAVQAKCAGQSFVSFIANLCDGTGTKATCTAACLANLKTTGSCSEIDCGFCTLCDCAAPTMPSPFATCLAACATQGLD